MTNRLTGDYVLIVSKLFIVIMYYFTIRKSQKYATYSTDIKRYDKLTNPLIFLSQVLPDFLITFCN